MCKHLPRRDVPALKDSGFVVSDDEFYMVLIATKQFGDRQVTVYSNFLKGIHSAVVEHLDGKKWVPEYPGWIRSRHPHDAVVNGLRLAEAVSLGGAA